MRTRAAACRSSDLLEEIEARGFFMHLYIFFVPSRLENEIEINGGVGDGI
jgi:hypothetical protein